MYNAALKKESSDVDAKSVPLAGVAALHGGGPSYNRRLSTCLLFQFSRSGRASEQKERKTISLIAAVAAAAAASANHA